MIPAVKKFAVCAGTFVILTSASSLAWATGLTVPNTFTSGTPALAAEVNGNFSAVKAAVDDNFSKITTNTTDIGTLQTTVGGHTTSIGTINSTNSTQTTDIATLKGNYASGSCVDNSGAADTNMVRVGPICVDKYMARATIGACTGDGTTGCGSVVAVSTATGSAALDFSWAQAQRACINAGKRLPTPGEWIAAYISGVLTDSAVDKLEFVDSMLTISSTTPGVDPAGDGLAWSGDPSSPGAAIPAQGGYMGPRTAAGGKVQMITNVDYDLVNADGGGDYLFFRCVR